MTRRAISILAVVAWAATTAAVPAVAGKDRILSAYAGNTLYEDAPSYQWAGFYDRDGTARARGWTLLGGEDATGEWRVTDAGLFCIKWNREDWAGGNENCYKVEISGKKTIQLHVSGKGGGDRTLVIKSGNPYKL